MPVSKDLITKKLEFLDRHLSAIERRQFDEQTFVADEDIHDLVTFHLQQAVETCIDIANHIINSLDLPRRETAKDAFILLGEHKIIERGLALKMGRAADFRNRVVHGYNNFDYRLLFADYNDNVKDLRLFGKNILVFLEKVKTPAPTPIPVPGKREFRRR